MHQACATVHALVDLLVERGLLDEEELDACRQQAAEQLRKVYVGKGMAVALQEFGVSKYASAGGTEVDCENRVHLFGLTGMPGGRNNT